MGISAREADQNIGILVGAVGIEPKTRLSLQTAHLPDFLFALGPVFGEDLTVTQVWRDVRPTRERAIWAIGKISAMVMTQRCTAETPRTARSRGVFLVGKLGQLLSDLNGFLDVVVRLVNMVQGTMLQSLSKTIVFFSGYVIVCLIDQF